MTPNFYLRYSKFSLGKGLVKMSTTYSLVLIYSNLIFFSCDLFPKKVKLDWNVLGIGMHNSILGDTDGTRIVTYNRDQLITCHVYVLQGLLHLKNLSITSCC